MTPRRLADSRGYFVETYTQRAFHEAGITTVFRQDNQSLSIQRGTIRGLHFQLAPEPQTKLVRVVAGSVFDVAVDLRGGSATYGKWCGATLTANAGEELLIPIGFAHAFCTLEPDTLVALQGRRLLQQGGGGGSRLERSRYRDRLASTGGGDQGVGQGCDAAAPRRCLDPFRLRELSPCASW